MPGNMSDTTREVLYKNRLADSLLNAGVAINDIKKLWEDSGYGIFSGNGYSKEILGVAKQIRDGGYTAAKAKMLESFDRGDYSLSIFNDERKTYKVSTHVNGGVADKSFDSIEDAYLYAYNLSFDNTKFYPEIGIELRIDKEASDSDLTISTLKEGRVKFGGVGTTDIWYEGSSENVIAQISTRAEWLRRNYIHQDKYKYIVGGITEQGYEYFDRYDTAKETVENFYSRHMQYGGETYISYGDTEQKFLQVGTDNIIYSIEHSEHISDQVVDEVIDEMNNVDEIDMDSKFNKDQTMESIPDREETAISDRKQDDPVKEVNKTDKSDNFQNEDYIERITIAKDISSLIYGENVTQEQFEDIKDCVLYFDGSSEGEQMLVRDIIKIQDDFSDRKMSYEYMKSQEVLSFLKNKGMDTTQKVKPINHDKKI